MSKFLRFALLALVLNTGLAFAANSVKLRAPDDKSTVSQLSTTPTRRSSRSKSGHATVSLSGAAGAAEGADGLFLEARDSCATSPESAGFAVAAATIASTCFASMRLARYS